MFSIQKFFGKDPKFFELLESAAVQSTTAASALTKVIENPAESANLHTLRDIRRKSKEIFEEISEMVVTTFVTSLDREDIEGLSAALYRIPKPMEKFAHRLIAANGIVHGIDFSKQASVIGEATETVVQLVREVSRSGQGNLETVKKMNIKLHAAEAQADALELDLLRDLYKSPAHDPIRIIVIKDLYEILEKVVDRCRDVGNVVTHIVLKNS